jgi:hypothetical protein
MLDNKHNADDANIVRGNYRRLLRIVISARRDHRKHTQYFGTSPALMLKLWMVLAVSVSVDARHARARRPPERASQYLYELSRVPIGVPMVQELLASCLIPYI